MPFPSPISSAQFRLLAIIEIEPVVRIEVETCDLGETSRDFEYFALSYAWGNEGQTEPIIANDATLGVTPNLYSALCELHRRNEIKGSRHWIDQICIDQKNHAERAAQVGVMDRIYAGAKRVLVWLGPADDESNLAMDNLRKLTEDIGPDIPQDWAGKERIQSRLAPRSHPVWRAIVKFFARPWFQRVWILQEAVLASGIFVLCGDRTLVWSTVVGFANAISAVWPAVLLTAGFDDDDPFVSGFVSCSQIEQFRTTPSRDLVSNFNNLLITTRDRRAKSPIDHVYGILGLVSEEQRAWVNIDYDLSYEESTVQFCKNYICNDSTYSVLGLAPSINRSELLPSWCPDFGSLSSEKSYLHSYIGFRAGFTERQFRASKVRVQSENTISVPGFRLDVVDRVVQRNFQARGQIDPAESQRNIDWESECRSLLHAVVPEPSEGVLEKYRRTLIAGHFAAIRPVPTTHSLRAQYEDWKVFLSDIASSRPSNFGSSSAKDAALQYGIAVDLQSSRKFFSTEGGRVGMGPSRVQPGDVVCVFESGAPLYVLRYDQSPKVASLVGDAYIPGLMDLSSTPTAVRGRDESFIIR